MNIEDLVALDYDKKNHASFEDCQGEEAPPAALLVSEHMNNKFGMLFADKESAVAYMKGNTFPPRSTM